MGSSLLRFLEENIEAKGRHFVHKHNVHLLKKGTQEEAISGYEHANEKVKGRSHMFRPKRELKRSS